jgi:hypothetical protein
MAQACPRAVAPCKARRIRDRAPSGWAEFRGHKPPAIPANTPIVSRDPGSAEFSHQTGNWPRPASTCDSKVSWEVGIPRWFRVSESPSSPDG